MDERAFYTETQTTKPATLNCPYCRTAETYQLRWVVRKKKDRLPGGADERDRAKFAKWQSYMVLLDDKVNCAAASGSTSRASRPRRSSEPYSYFRARTGSTATARCAGTQLAKTVTAPSIAAITRNVTRSNRLT
jgi:hypothetical protein